MRFAVDGMGGDLAPVEVVKGCVEAVIELGVEITITGPKDQIETELAKYDYDKSKIEVLHTTEVVGTDEAPVLAIRRKKDSSMAVALNLLRDGAGDAVVSAGSTGALLTGATLTVKRIRGIRRAALAPVLPAGEHGVMLIDCGATVNPDTINAQINAAVDFAQNSPNPNPEDVLTDVFAN